MNLLSTKEQIFLSVVATFITIGIIGSIWQYQDAQATGCPVSFVNEHIDNALKAFDEKNAEELKHELDLAREALDAAAAENE